MITKKIIISLLIVLCTFTQSFAIKSLNYDDIYEIILSGDKDKAYTLLLAYQKQDPDFANTYFQLALIAKDWTKEFNPFTEFTYTKQFIYNTELYFKLAKLKLKDEQKKNRVYYLNAGIVIKDKKLKIEEITDFIDSQIADIKIYEENIINIINYYNKSSDFYNNCVDIFMEINIDYNKIKNIYLAEDDKFYSKLNLLEINFDSTLIYFSKYKDAIKKYPVSGYNQEYKLKEIITYRLDGLTNSNFLNNNISLWDFKKWAEEVKKTKDKRINNNRADIVNIETNMKNIIRQLSEENYSDNYKNYMLDEKLVYKIEKYDNNSLIIKLFKLNESKINFLTFYRKDMNNPKSEKNYTLEKNVSYHYKLFNKQHNLDSLNKIFLEGIKPEEIKKYKKFYLSYYAGMKGLKDYSLRQNLFLKSKQKEADERLKESLYKAVYQIPFKELIYKNYKITTKLIFPDFELSEKDTYNICSFKSTDENKFWVTGFYKSKDNNIQAFTALTDDKNSLKFIKKSEKSDTSTIFRQHTEVFPGGAFTIETSIGNQITNTLIKYNNNGTIILKKILPFNKIPRFLSYDDINNKMIIVFNGNKIDIKQNPDNEHLIYHINLDDELKSFIINYKAKASVFDIIRLNNDILIFSNFVNYTGTNNNIINSDAGSSFDKTNILVTVISNGIIKKQVPIKSKEAVFGLKAVKINSNLINVLGFKTKYTNKEFENLKNKDLYKIYLNPDVKQLYTAWHD